MGTQVLIIQAAGVVFVCSGLSVAQWLFCTSVGLFELIWQQVICFIPDSILDSCFAPKNLPEPSPSSENNASSGNTVADVEYESQVPEVSAAASNRGQVLWFRGLNRIQQQNTDAINQTQKACLRRLSSASS